SSFLSRSTANSVSNQSSRISSSYSNNNTNTNAYRPLNSLTNTSSTYNSSSFLHDQPEPSRFISTAYKPYESIHEPYLSSRLNALRTGKYVPPILSRFNLP
ncbi:unnamed protein product, partial [Rotaria magnacalcarata]